MMIASDNGKSGEPGTPERKADALRKCIADCERLYSTLNAVAGELDGQPLVHVAMTASILPCCIQWLNGAVRALRVST
jgi:hypothetical protein